VHEDARQIEDAGHPGHDAQHVKALDPEHGVLRAPERALLDCAR
jgi:hypothetical protein